MAIGIVCEYNPFHKGHQYQLQTAQALSGSTDTPIICVMSGHYVQRGEPALLDKWTRTRMALAGGASLVIELPTYYSTATAEWFAKGAISLLYHTGITDSLSFGTEAPDELCSLQTLCEHLVPESSVYQTLLQQNLSQAPSFAAAREQTLQTLAGHPLHLQSPNTILVLEYLKAARSLSWQPKLLPVERISAGYHDLSTQAEFPSASAIRRQAETGHSIQPYLPDCCPPFDSNTCIFPKDLFQFLPYVLCQHSAETLQQIDEVSEGLENRILDLSLDAPVYEELLERLKTKRYPTSRLRRILLNTLLNITKIHKQELNFTEGPSYIRVLGFRRECQNLLSQLAEKASLPVVTNLSRQLSALPSPAKAMLEDEIRFSQIYSATHKTLKRDCEYRMPMIIL